MKVSRMGVIRQLVRKEYGAVRPTADKILTIVKKYELNLYTSDGKRRSREVLTKSMAKAVAKLK